MTEELASPGQKTVSFYLKRIIGILLLLVLSAVFFYSAYSKSGIAFKGFNLVGNEGPFMSFQWTFIDLGINSIVAAGIVARLFIGLEFLLGLLLLFHIFLRQFTYKIILVLLSVFTVYLLFVIINQGNHGNCGCFGDNIEMTPLQSVWKNVIMIIITLILIYIYPAKPYKNQEIIAVLLFMAALVTPFILNPLDLDNKPEAAHQTIDLNPLYKEAPVPATELRTGKHIVAFMSLTCPHCRKAAYMLHVIHDKNPGIPIYILLSGSDNHEKEFFDETHAMDVPHLHVKDIEAFQKMAGPYVPAIYWVNNGIIERKANYFQLDPKYMHEWLGQ
ncbi:MAG: hypothetical protein BGO69_11155 [Bacteroidetes bacterium 46-16]|mgnify:CR=1 FL=1|nr:MAG: hypothetical protein BGO69_11155 [Bacteroidetes bacterium 46-16]